MAVQMRCLAGVLLVCLAIASANAAEGGMKALVKQAKAAGPVKVFDAHIGEVNGRVSDVAGDAFCVRVDIDGAGKAVEYCYPYAAIETMIKPGTGAHHDFTSIWMRGARR